MYTHKRPSALLLPVHLLPPRQVVMMNGKSNSNNNNNNDTTKTHSVKQTPNNVACSELIPAIPLEALAHLVVNAFQCKSIR